MARRSFLAPSCPAAAFAACGLHPGFAAAMQQYFFFAHCPVPGCKHETFKKNIWGWSEVEARERLSLHLQRSGNHNMEKDEADHHAEAADIEQGEHSPQPQQKRPRPPSSEPPASLIVDQVAAEVERRVVQRIGALEDVGSVGPDVRIRRVDFQAIVDSVARAELAVRQAQRLSSAASRAFSDEAAVLSQVKMTLEDIAANNDDA